jgi:hypothetical protein
MSEKRFSRAARISEIEISPRPNVRAALGVIRPEGRGRWRVRIMTASISRSWKFVSALHPAVPAVMAIPAVTQPRGLKEIESTLVATKVAVREVKTRRYHIFGFVYS